MCGKETDKKYRPFCSRRCADLDLAKWLSGSYVIPSDEPVEESQLPDIAAQSETKH